MKKSLPKITIIMLLLNSAIVSAEGTYISKIDNHAIVNSVLVNDEVDTELVLPENTNNFGFSKIECGILIAMQ